MLLAESIKNYACRYKTDKALFSYLETEHEVVMFDPGVHVENITAEWLEKFRNHSGMKHVRNVRKVVKNL